MKAVAVIMAGGLGARLWPRSTERLPKQFMHMIGEGSMIQNTVARLQSIVPIDDTFVVTTPDFIDVISKQLPQLPPENIITEPFARNTAPCMALAALHLRKRISSDAVMITIPSDHYIYNVREFHHSLEVAAMAADATESIATIGVRPTRAEAGFGYIQISDADASELSLYGEDLRHVSVFAEKPDKETAQRFVDAGDFLWNCGIFIWKMSTFWNSFTKHLPDHAALFALLDSQIGKESYGSVLDNIYRQMRSVSLDYGILEKADNVVVVKSSFGWSDLGSWDEVYRLSPKDTKNNSIEGDVVALNSTNCFVSSNQKLIALVNVDDLIVVDTGHALLITKRGESETVKDLVDYLRRKQINHYL